MPENPRRNFLKQATAGVHYAGDGQIAAGRGCQRENHPGPDRLRQAGRKICRSGRFRLRSRPSRLAAAARRAGVDPAHAVTDLRRILDDRDDRRGCYRDPRSLARPGGHSGL